jgi:hypothetical protein
LPEPALVFFPGIAAALAFFAGAFESGAGLPGATPITLATSPFADIRPLP